SPAHYCYRTSIAGIRRNAPFPHVPDIGKARLKHIFSGSGRQKRIGGMQSTARVSLGRLLGTAAALGVCLWMGPSFVGHLRPPRTVMYDFFQEYASARNCFEGLAVYTHQDITAARYLGYRRQSATEPMLEYNAHPPTAVALVLPLAELDYPDAYLAWALLS